MIRQRPQLQHRPSGVLGRNSRPGSRSKPPTSRKQRRNLRQIHAASTRKTGMPSTYPHSEAFRPHKAGGSVFNGI
ncbi:hypothetical protein J2W33_006624 [Variovorax boronicumulans]|nr:hypothetical protein [Variovorax boronicumulans]